MDWEDCLNRRIAKKVSLDSDLIRSLIKSSSNKLESECKLKISPVTASSKLSLAYDSLRELLEALALKNGYKIYNHECYSAFLKEILNQSSYADEFSEIRKIRNDVNYYGKEISPEESGDMIKKIRQLRSFVLNLLNQQNI